MINEYHVMPHGDIVEHDPSIDCICGPTLDVGSLIDEAILGEVFIHHSLDGREISKKDDI